MYLSYFLKHILDKEKNYFEALELKSAQASLKEINEAFERLNKKYNPAFNIEKESVQKSKDIQEAFSCLKFPQCKQQYFKYGFYIE